MDAAPQVTVVIPSWNSEELLPRCLESLSGQEVAVETIVVDNGSVDGSREVAERHGARLVSLPCNLGFAVAVNRGVAAGSAPYVLPLNADTALEPGCLAALLAALAADPGLGAAAPRILQLEPGVDGTAAARLYSAGQALTRDGRALELGAGRPQGPPFLERREVFGVCGAACLLRRELFEALGGYEERYFAFYEDVDLNVRAQVAGWRAGYVPEAAVWHVGNASWTAEVTGPSAWNARLVARNRLATQLKFLPARALPLLLAVEAGALARAGRQRRLRATLRGKLEAFGWLGWVGRERRRLRADGDLGRARRWLGDRGV